jgi:DNA-binding NtrC family response regulator
MTRARVLVVEDKPHRLDLVASILAESHDVTKAPDGAEALGILEAQPPFDVVVTDVRMPKADGFQVLAAARRRDPDTQVVLLTAYASIADAVAAMREGAYDYVEKPFLPDNLALVVARALEKRRNPRTPPLELGRAGAGGGGELGARKGFREVVSTARDRASHDYLVRLMREFQGNVTKASRVAGLARESLHRVLRRYGVRPEDFKKPDAQ